MAGTVVTIRNQYIKGSEADHLRLSLNKAIADLETLRSNPDTMKRNRCLANAAVAIGTTTSKAKTVNSISYAVDGALFTKAATDDFWTPAGATVAISSWQKYLLCVDNAGAASVVEGTPSTVSAAAVTLPALPASKSVVAVLTVATSGATTFIPGTTLLGAAGITATFVNGLDSGYFSSGAAAMTAFTVATFDN